MINMPFRNDNPALRRYDNLMVDVGNYIFEAECLLSTFIKDVLDYCDENILDIEIDLANEKMPGNLKFTISKIYWNDDSRSIEIAASNGKKTEQILDWDDLTIETKNLIANHIHINLLTEEIYDNLQKQ